MSENESRPRGRVRRAIGRPFRWVKRKLAKPAAFFAAGNRGGCIALAALGSQFMYAGLMRGLFSLNALVPDALLLSAAVPAFLLAAWLLRLGLRLVAGRTKYSKALFLLAWLFLSIMAVIASLGSGIGSGILLSFAVTLAVDVLGRVVWSVFSRNAEGERRSSVTGYIAGVIALAAVVAFAVFFHSQSFGDDLIKPYLDERNASARSSDKVGEDFAAYIAPGSKKVLTLDYGTSEDCDIVTGTADISKFAERGGMSGAIVDAYWDYPLDKAPIAGRIWYPEGGGSCPTMFIVHGNHDYNVPSYLGYDYLGEYLASFGYVVISVDENSCNGLSDENDARAVLLLENMKALYALNEDEGSPISGLIDEQRVAIAGHSRGGEMVATAFYFNGLDVYPDCGTIKLDYHFPIRSIIAIAPVADQYMPAGRPVEIEDVSYLVMHGANDQDVSSMYGEKQFHNVTFTEPNGCFKASVYMMGANHGQFNNQWGRYDMVEGANQLLNVNNFLSQDDQQLIAKAYIRTFLDVTVRGYKKYESLFYDCGAYADHLPGTVYVTTYEDSGFECINSFDDDADLAAATMDGVTMKAGGVYVWREETRVSGNGGEGENHVLRLKWGDLEDDGQTGGSDAEKKSGSSDPAFIAAKLPGLDLTEKAVSFDMCDMREDEDIGPVRYTVTLTDGSGKKASAIDPVYIYPSLKVQLSKVETVFGGYGYKHQLQTVLVRPDMLDAGGDFDISDVREIRISFPEMDSGDVQIDRLGLADVK